MIARARPGAVKGGRWRGLLFPALIVLAWLVVSHAGWGNRQIFVLPDAIGKAFVESMQSGVLPASIGATILRALAGFVLGGGAGLIAGVALAAHGGTRRFFGPTFNGAQQIALFAWIPLISAWLGTGEVMKVALVALGSFFPVLLNTEAGCLGVPKAYQEVGQLLELSRWEGLTKIVLPAALPAIASGLEIGFATAWLGTVGTEYLVGSGYVNGLGDGIGMFLAGAREYGRMDRVIVGIVVLALAGLLLDRLLVNLCRRLMPWQAR